MNGFRRPQVTVIITDLLMALAVFYFCRYSGGYPRWWWLVVSGLFWTLFGFVTHKLQFDKFRMIGVAVLAILVLNVFTYALILTTWILVFPERCTPAGQWHPLVILTLCEVLFYLLFRRLVTRKLPFLFDENIQYEKCEPSLSSGIRVEEDRQVFSDVFLRMYEATMDLGWKELKEWFVREKDTLGDSVILDSTRPNDIPAIEVRDSGLIIVTPAFNTIRHLNTFLAFSNYKLRRGGCLLLHGQTAGTRKELIYESNPAGLNRILYCFDYIWHRVFPKLRFTRWFYMAITKGEKRSLPRVELLGRLCRAGFTISGEDMRDGEYIVAAVKTSRPITDDKPGYGPLIRLKRIGYQGEVIGVLKVRTMYSYSEYLQKYAYDRLGLQDGGKIKSDFRVNLWGMIFRKVWIDELPMLFNWISGDLKLVGVRPLSQQYFSLYTPEMQALRTTVKPGLIPPFYYRIPIPKGIAEIQENERQYIEAYRKAPFRTDFKYFFVCIWNIVVRRARSK